LAALEMEQTGTRDHRGIVGREARRRRIHSYPALLESCAHRGDQRSVARDAAAEHDAVAPELASRAQGLLDERVDERILKRARDGGALRVDAVTGGLYRVEHGRLESAERHVEVVGVGRSLIATHHGSSEAISRAVARRGEPFEVRAPRIWES